MGKKTKKFLIICGIVVGAGLLLTIIGAAAGGISSRAANWQHVIHGSQVRQKRNSSRRWILSQTFNAVKVTGDADLDIVKGSEAFGQTDLSEGYGELSDGSERWHVAGKL